MSDEDTGQDRIKKKNQILCQGQDSEPSSASGMSHEWAHI